MIWDITYPQDDLQANTIHTILQNSKVLLRERMEVFNNSFKEHGDAFLDTSGQHVPSITGFCGIIENWESRPTVDLANGSLWFVNTEDHYRGLYYIDNGNYKSISLLSHNDLSNLYKDIDDNVLNPHNQYILIDGGSMSNDITFNILQLLLSDGNSSFCLPKSHSLLKFADAHLDGSLRYRHFIVTNMAISRSRLPIIEYTDINNIDITPNGIDEIIAFPLTKNASSVTTRVMMSDDSISASNTDIKVFVLQGNIL